MVAFCRTAALNSKVGFVVRRLFQGKFKTPFALKSLTKVKSFVANFFLSNNQDSLSSKYAMGTKFSRSFSPKTSETNATTSKAITIKPISPDAEYVESVVCNINDIGNNEMKVCNIGPNEDKVLLVKQKGEVLAVGTKCTHYGAPLINGALGDGRIRCPWHGACFNLKTGDIEDFPGFDSLPCYQVTINQDGGVKVRAKASELKSNKRIKDLGIVTACDQLCYVIIGAGPSGATCAEALRSEGYGGRIIMIGKEPYLPYDRIKVSKIGTVTDINKLQARTAQYYEDAKIEIMREVEATKVDTANRFVHLSNGKKIQYSALYIATGSRPRVPEIAGVNLKNIFTVRDFDDSLKILNTLGTEKDKNVVVLGLSFIGLETASTCNDKAKSMTVVGTDSAPLGRIFGHEIGRSIKNLFQTKGVHFEFETTIIDIRGDEDGFVNSVLLSSGKVLSADILILGIGTAFNTDFLKDSGISLEPNGAVNVDDKLQTNIENVFAGGDIANAPVYVNDNNKMAIGHIGLAQYHGRTAALNMLNKQIPLKTVPYFWTTLFGKGIRYCGYGVADNILVDGDIDALKFVIFFFDRNDKVIAVASCMRDPIVSQFGEFTYQGKTLYRKDLENDRFSWTKNIH